MAVLRVVIVAVVSSLAIACGGTGDPAQPTPLPADTAPAMPTAVPTTSPTTPPACAPIDAGSRDAGDGGAPRDAACE